MGKAKLDVEKLWRETNIMGIENRYYTRELMGFLFGYCAHDEQFLEGVDRYLKGHAKREKEMKIPFDTEGITFECLACGTTLKEEDAEYKNGYLTCPSCGSEELFVKNPEQEE